AKRVEEGFTEFHTAIATPDMMPVVGRLGRILGPQGKMPNPKVGTVTQDVRKAVEEAKAGKVEYRTDRHAIVHLVIGRRDFDEQRLLENYAAVIEELIRAKPSAAKGRYLRTITLSTTMSPGVDESAQQRQGADAIIAVDYRGISVPRAAELRARLREADASFRVVKNRLTLRAAEKAGTEQIQELLDGPTALTFVRGDAALA